MVTIEIILTDSLALLVAGSFRSNVLKPESQTGAKSLHIKRSLAAETSIKDAIEAVGIPHCEIGQIRERAPEDGQSPSPATAAPVVLRHLDDPVRDGDILEIRPQPSRALTQPRFLCDQHLGKLARLLRILGFDTLWTPTWTEPEIARLGVNDHRVVLSRSRSLLKRREMDQAQLIVSDDPDTQVSEVIRRWFLAGKANLFGRCSRCNGTLRPVEKSDVAARIPPKTARWLNEYYLCIDCDQLFWKGTHVLALTERLDKILARCSQPSGKENGSGE
ncbi:MAG: Mut7-C ubiquitin/RNAse domain-containing protein [Gemmatimonadales bacterium]|nr:Mut7-C ubiquitin/RNAse domain-containing protein [Gemmatimonadales bacterium]